MEVIGKIKIKGFLTYNDLENGEVFTFLDDSEPYMFCSDNYDSYIVNLNTGFIENTEGFSERPIRTLKAKLIIED